MPDIYSACILPLLVTVIGGTILLILEYRTHWFAQYRARLEHRPAPPRRTRSSRTSSEPNDWGEAIAKARMTYAKMQGLSSNQVLIERWALNWNKTEVKIKLSYPKKVLVSQYARGRGYFKVPTESYHRTFIVADKKGRIIKEQNHWSFFDYFG